MRNILQGYTLIELLIVIVIIGLMSVFSIPAFANHGKVETFYNNAEEVRLLITRAEALSRSPEQNIAQYEVVVDDSIDNKHKIILQKCTVLNVSKRCESSNVETIKVVNLSSKQEIQTSGYYFACSTDYSQKCISNNGGSNLSIVDNNSAVNKAADYEIEGIGASNLPFKVKINTIDN